jgi:hypothetical protein
MRAHGPWRIEDRTERFRNAFLHLDEDRVTQPDGKPVLILKAARRGR